jgi:ribosomal protein S18 acetylase RimI-like enzyme
MTFRITPASQEDAPLVFDIMQHAFAEYLGVLDPPSGVHAETLDDVIHAMDDGGAVLAWIDNQPVGTARYAYHGDSCYIGRVSVLPAYRGQGIASAMMDYIEGIARAHGSAYLEIAVRVALESNVHLYERIGYTITETFEHPKGGGMVATMVKRL